MIHREEEDIIENLRLANLDGKFEVDLVLRQTGACIRQLQAEPTHTT
jgi:hypothetical protein